MRSHMLLTLALVAGAGATFVPGAAEADSPRLPSAPLRIDEQCLGPAVQYDRVQGGVIGGSSLAPATASAPARGLGSSGRGYGSGGVSTGAKGGGARAKRKDASAPPPPPAPSAMPMEESFADAEAPAGADLDDAVAEAPSRETQARGPVGPRVDWGGETWLSNDDSMSLASAQRLLFALDRNVGFDLGQIRPHELLNYFTFDTTQPRGNDLFAVHSSAEVVDGDTLSLALAVQGATPDRAPLDLTLLIDRSGSMSAEGRIGYTHRALRHIADNMRPGDRIDISVFDDRACTPVKDFVVGRDDPGVLYSTISRIQPRGSTDLDLGLKEAYRVATEHTADPGRDQRVMVFTDALLNTGDVNPHTVTEIGKALDAHDIRLTGVGVGKDFRDDVLDRLTEKGKGAYVFLGSERVVDRLFDSGFEALVSTIAHDVRFKLDLPPSLGMEKFYGEESSTRKEDVQAVHFHAGNSQVFLQDLAIRNRNLVRSEPLSLEISWDDPATGQRVTQTHTTTVGQALSADPHNSRKGRALMAWTDILTHHAMGADACGTPFSEYRQSISGLQGDAEIAYVSELVGRWCDFSTPVASWTAPAFLKVRLDSDVAISSMDLDCNGSRLSASDSVARLEATPGTCNLTLYGAVPMTTTVQVPETGSDMRCTIRGGRLSCT